ncbi:hypothetical protein LPH50_06900 [Xylella taiwanensis]|uniref:Uncharacterized protein n=1 Tax=Xylella taiwanensis TaxID=1444770 RepID=Z9JIU1_9GAMM|nr:hypothetical protein [Xylella taiwanensis]AXI82689.1 hypothetical protein AB672_01230 [Xylella taiwanensis]EWS78330.1 hypothetical protein AF72_06450 [Xylella taiwanensis]MCD8455685.1 hypothetical protein [Xylella taiwanensis]MCD8458092.1 hypothetical protein [Xylella taiwanensis]MCD8460228.1 hypothetical protein [Xylella taiwanensis]
MSKVTFTFRVDEVLKNAFATTVKAHDHSGALLLHDFICAGVQEQQQAAEHDAWFHRQVQTGLDSANVACLVPVAKVEVKCAVCHVAGSKHPNDGIALDARSDL